MDALEAIHTRRSVRSFTGEPVSKEQIEELLKAGMTAPSGCNSQPWHFVTVTDRKLLNGIMDFHGYAKMLKEAPLAIVVCAQPSLAKSVCKEHDFWPQDCSAATLNILTAARAIGLAGVWCGVYPREDYTQSFRELLNIPQDIIPFSLLAIGKTEVNQDRKDRFLPERIHENMW